MSGNKVEVENVNVPGQVTRADSAKDYAMKAAMVTVMTGADPMTAKAIKDAAKAHLPEDLFPGGATSGWWQKCVQLDLEAKKIIQRHESKPLTFSLA